MKKLLLISIALTLSTSVIRSQWNQSFIGVTGLRDISVVDNNVVWVSDPSDSTFSITSDGGISWITKTLPGILFNNYVYHSGISAVSSTTAYLVLANAGTANGIYKTTDSGNNWVRQTTGFNENSPFPDFVFFWDTNNGVAVGDALSSGNFEIYTTNNGGIKWDSVPSANMPAGNYETTWNDRSAAFRVHGDTIYFLTARWSGNQRIFKSADKGVSWTVINTPFKNNGTFDFKDKNRGLFSVRGSASDTIYSTTDGGQNWIKKGIISTIGYYLNYIQPANAYTCTNKGFSYSTDNGQTWIANPSFNGVLLRGVGYSPSGKIFIGGNGYVYSSTNYSGTNLAITKTQIINQTNIDVTFSSNVDLQTAQDTSNYLVSYKQNNVTQKMKLQAIRDNSNNSLVHLLTSTNIPCGLTITTTVKNIKDLNGFPVINGSASSTSTNFYTLPLTVSTNSLNIDPVGNSSATFTISTLANWNITCLNPWIKTNVVSGTGNATLIVTGDLNYTSLGRVTNIIVSENSVPMQTITLTQAVEAAQSGHYLTVTTGIDSLSGSLRDVINKAQKGDIVIFDKNLTEINLGAPITFDKSITIYGNPNLLIHDNQWGSSPTDLRFFEINGNDSIVVNISTLNLGKKKQSIVDIVDMDGKIILISNNKATINIDFCNFFYENNSYGGRASCSYSSNGTILPVNGQNGGGIAQHGGVLNISNCTFSKLYAGNFSYWGAGGAIFQSGGKLNLLNCTFYNNSGGVNSCTHIIGTGSSIYSQNSVLSITNCTFCNNTNTSFYFSPLPNPLGTTIRSSTNTIVQNNSILSIRNSVFYENEGYDIQGTVNSGGYNIFSQSIVSGSVSTDIFNSNPGFKNGAVLSTGTFWIPVCALDSAGSAVNALPPDGNGAPNYDERGFARAGLTDIGAYEYNGTAPALTVSTNNLTIAALTNSTNTFGIFSNVYWTVASGQTWLTLNSLSGSGNASITITATGNSTNVSRTATVVVSGAGLTPRIITVEQDAMSTSINDTDADLLSIFPNPVINELTINGIGNNAVISIYDLTGKLKISKIASSPNEIIDVSSLSNGVYLIKVTDNKTLKTDKFIKK